MKKLTIIGAALSFFTMSSGAQAAYMPYSCTWIEKAGTVLSSVPMDTKRKLRDLEERITALESGFKGRK